MKLNKRGMIIVKYDFIVFGATGIQGKIVSRDLLSKGYKVLLCGRDRHRLLSILKKFKLSKFRHIEATDQNSMINAIKCSGSDILINCIEGDFNLNVMEACQACRCNCIDLGSEVWMTKAQLKKHDLWKRLNIISITGIGSVPGIGNVMLKYASEKLDSMSSVEVGFSWDSNMKRFVVPFSIKSIIEEFTDPALIVENKKFKYRSPLNSIIEDYHRGIGIQKEFVVKHPEQYTFLYYFKEKGLKNIRFYAGFPEHSFRTICTLIDLGLGGKDDITCNGIKIRPIDFLTELLKTIKIPKGYKEKENLWVRIHGHAGSSKKEILMECIVPTLENWKEAGCNIDTGIPASIVAQMIRSRTIMSKGSFSPEAVVPPEIFFRELRKYKMQVLENSKKINNL